MGREGERERGRKQRKGRERGRERGSERERWGGGAETDWEKSRDRDGQG